MIDSILGFVIIGLACVWGFFVLYSGLLALRIKRLQRELRQRRRTDFSSLFRCSHPEWN